jgi:tetratricopeptide (TPR) repeat protein
MSEHAGASASVADGRSPRKGIGQRWTAAMLAIAILVLGGFLVGRATAPESDARPPATERSVGDLLAEAVALHASGLTDLAIDQYDAILVVEPGNALALYNLGQISQQRGALDRAIDLYDRALQNDPSLTSAAFNRAIALRDSGRESEAVTGFEAIIADDPESVGALFNLGNLYIALGDPERGVALINRAIELDPSLRGD